MKSSTSCTEPYSVINVCKKSTIRIQKDSYQKELICVESLHSIKSSINYYLRGEWHTFEYKLYNNLILKNYVTQGQFIFYLEVSKT
jgi:hypothetical protein